MKAEEFRTLYAQLPPGMTTSQRVCGRFFGRNAMMMSGYSTGRMAIPVEIANLMKALVQLHALGKLEPIMLQLEQEKHLT